MAVRALSRVFDGAFIGIFVTVVAAVATVAMSFFM